MIYEDDLKRIRDECISTLELSIKCAKQGHNHISDNVNIKPIVLLEIISELLNFREKDDFGGIKDDRFE